MGGGLGKQVPEEVGKKELYLSGGLENLLTLVGDDSGNTRV